MFYQEREWIALRKSIIIEILLIISSIVIFMTHFSLLLYTGISIEIILVLLLVLPIDIRSDITDNKPASRFDERDIMFSRKELIPGSDKYNSYYKAHPELEEKDNLFRAEPGLLSKDAAYYNRKAFNRADKYFREIKDLHPLITGKPNHIKASTDPLELSLQIKNLAKELGALDVGITKVMPYHFYSIKGRGPEYGRKIEIIHDFAIAFTVEMNYEMVMAAPKASIVMESARQYLSSAKIAVEIAQHIHNLGFNARAHIDGNYQVICPLVAWDAGLGELGRMGLLMTPGHGPRVRIGVITTDMVLIPDHYQKQESVLDFCRMCEKCADCCPGNSIPHGDPEKIDGVRRWKINSESCFTIWCKVGTDCGRCMSVCPYAHKNNFIHNLIRKGIGRSKPFRYIALKLDDFFYGKIPLPKPLPAELEE
jgi:reductive dehalogenase